MTTRISLKDAERLGLLPTGGVPVAGRPAAKPIPPRNALKVPSAPRKSSKGGRAARTDRCAVERMSFRLGVTPKTKQRARTSMPKQEIERAFLAARGSVDRFRALLSGIRHHSYTPEDTKEFEGLVGTFGARAMGSRAPFECPVVVRITLAFEGDPATWPTDVTDPDLDNAVKAVFDGLNKIAYKDDRLVVGKTVRKICAREPYVAVSLRALVPSLTAG